MKLSDGSWPNSVICLLILSSLLMAGCSRHEGISISDEVASPDQHLPFDRTSDKGGIFPTGSLTPAAIPAGTPLSIHLRTALSSATSQAGDAFEAVLDEPIVVHGRVVAPRGSSIVGKVLDARAAGELQESGYMRLALTAVSLHGKSVPIQTSSIFVKRSPHRRETLTALAGAPSGGVSAMDVPTGSVMIDRVSTSDLNRTGLNRTSQASLIGATTGTAAEIRMDPPVEIRDVGISAGRQLTFRLAQPLPLV
jgi:hypothetical protein